MAEELHPLTDKYFERVRGYLERRGLWGEVVRRFARGAPAPAGERRIREAVSRILDRCEHHGVDPELLDWDVIAERFQFHETVEGLLRDLYSGQLIPPPAPGEGAAYLEELEREARRLLSVFEQLPPDARERLLRELLSRTERLRRVEERARRAEELERELRRLRRELKRSEEELRRLREELRRREVAPPPAPPTPAPPPKPEWEQRLERMKAEFDRRVRDWAELFVPAARREVFLRRASEVWRDYAEPISALLRRGEAERAELLLREALREAGFALLDAARDPRRAAEALVREGVLSREELPPTAAPPPPEGREGRRYRPVYPVVPWHLTPRPVNVADPNPWRRLYGDPLFRAEGGTVLLHHSTRSALLDIAKSLGVEPPAALRAGYAVGRLELEAFARALLAAAEPLSGWYYDMMREWLRDFLGKLREAAG